MRPLPQTIQVLDDLSRRTGTTDLLAELQSMADRVQTLVPDCIALSLAWLDHGLTFTLVASDQQVAVLDALQHLDVGAGVESPRVDTGPGTSVEELFAEDQWRSTAQGTAAPGVRCSLTFPLMAEDRTAGSVNLYGASSRAFDGHHEELADILGAWAPGAVSNADLTFESRQQAQQAPEHLRTQGQVDRAVGFLAASFDIDLDAAWARLQAAAQQDMVSVEDLAAQVLALSEAGPDDDRGSQP